MVRRGEIWLVDFDPGIGAEMRKTRPAVVLQNDIGNTFSPVTVIAPITSRPRGKTYPFEAITSPADKGVDAGSRIALNHLRSIDKSRLRRKIGALSIATLLLTEDALRDELAL